MTVKKTTMTKWRMTTSAMKKTMTAVGKGPTMVNLMLDDEKTTTTPTAPTPTAPTTTAPLQPKGGN